MNAKDLITSKLQESKAMLPEADDDEPYNPDDLLRSPGPGPGGQYDEPPQREPAPAPGMRRSMRPVGPGGRPGGPPGLLNPRERDALKGIVMYELLNMVGRDQYYLNLVKTVLGGTDPDPGQIKHILDEANRFADLLDENQRAVLDKLSRLPQK